LVPTDVSRDSSTVEPTPFRLIMSGTASGAWNMGVDEALLIDAAEHGVGTLRFYTWSEPTLSLGYFQRYEDRHQHAASRDCACVRRQTGGGAILHDQELTYSITLPPRHPLTRHSETLYTVVHEAFIRVLADQPDGRRLPAELRRVEEMSNKPSDREEPFLCFERRTPGDVVAASQNPPTEVDVPVPFGAAGIKILGSAQRRSRGALLQHGSLLLTKSAAAPELPGYTDVTGAGFTSVTLATLAQNLEKALQAACTPSELSPSLELKAGELANTKYGVDAWTKRR
jgi:lipoate-protein ligase A